LWVYTWGALQDWPEWCDADATEGDHAYSGPLLVGPAPDYAYFCDPHHWKHLIADIRDVLEHLRYKWVLESTTIYERILIPGGDGPDSPWSSVGYRLVYSLVPVDHTDFGPLYMMGSGHYRKISGAASWPGPTLPVICDPVVSASPWPDPGVQYGVGIIISNRAYDDGVWSVGNSYYVNPGAETLVQFAATGDDEVWFLHNYSMAHKFILQPGLYLDSGTHVRFTVALYSGGRTYGLTSGSGVIFHIEGGGLSVDVSPADIQNGTLWSGTFDIPVPTEETEIIISVSSSISLPLLFPGRASGTGKSFSARNSSESESYYVYYEGAYYGHAAYSVLLTSSIAPYTP
jgi:hypothetical protein